MEKYKNVWIAIVIILVVIVIVAIYLINNGKPVDPVDLQIMGDKNFNVVPLVSDSTGMAIDSGLKIISKEDKNINDIKEILTIEPAESYEIKKVSNQEFVVEFNTQLKSNTVYRISMKESDNDNLSWAYQTVKSFDIVSTLPRDKGTGVPIDTGIELQFSYPYIIDLENNFSIEPKVKGKFVYNKNLAVFMPKEKLELDTVYTVTINAGVGIEGSDKVIDEDYSFQFLTEAEAYNRDYINFTETLYNFTSDTSPYFQVFASENIRDNEMDVNVYQYRDEDAFISDIKTLSDIDSNWSNMINKTIDINKDFTNVMNFKSKLLKMDNYGLMYYISLPNELKEGYYLVNVNNEGKNYQTHLQVNDAAVYIMLGEYESLAWVNDIKTGDAITGAKFSTENSKSVATDKNGVAVIKEPIVSRDDFTQLFFKVSFDNRPTYISHMINNYFGFDYFDYQQNNDYWSYLYLDRELYLPSDTVNFWGLVKAREGVKGVNSLTAHLYKSTYNDEKNEIEKVDLKLDDFGSFDNKMSFDGLIPGRYYLELNNGEETIIGKYIEVRDYEKPTFKIDMEFDKEAIFGWETAILNIQSNFFEGSPFSGLKLKASYYEDNKTSNINNIVSDKNGFSQIKYIPAIKTDKWNPVNIYFDISNDQAENLNITANESIMVFPKSIMINIDIEDQDNAGVIKVKTNLIDINKSEEEINKGIGERSYTTYEDRYKGAPIDTGVNISIYEITYTNEETGEYYDFINKKVQKIYKYTEHKNLAKQMEAVTKNGVYTFNYQFEDEKNYEIIVDGKDTRGNKVVQDTYMYKYIYNNDYYGMKNYYFAEADKEKSTYKIGDKINLKLLCNEEEVAEISGDKLLYLKLKDGLQDFNISENVKNTFVFNEKDIPNFYYSAAYFDGKNMYLVGAQGINYDYTEKSLDLTVTADKESYKPGETVNLDFIVKDLKGKPQKANVNLSIVDEAMFALMDQSVDTVASIYNYSFHTGIIQSHVSFREMDLSAMAEKGGDGDYSDYIRSDFKDTAEFKTVTTGADGKGSYSFKVPDNLTSWRITYQGITKDLLAGSGKINVNSKIPYFITLINNDFYMNGDTPSLSVRSYGTETTETDEIKYRIALIDEAGDSKEFNITSKGNDYANINLGKLSKGKYTLIVEGKNGKYSDGIKEEFEVVDSMLKTNIAKYLNLENNTKITDTEGYVNINFYNKNSSIYFNTLSSLSYTWGQRVDQLLARKIATELMGEYFEEIKINNEEYKFDQYQLGDGGIALLSYSESDVLLSAKVASVAKDLFDEYRLKEYFYSVINNKEAADIDIATAYWGLASLNEPVLLDIQGAIKNKEMSIKEKMLIGIALAEFGDINGANQLYIDLMNNYGKRMGEYVYIDTGIDKDDLLEATSLMSIMASKLNADDKNRLLDYVTNNRTEKILTYLEQLIFVKANLPKIDKEVSFNYTLDGEKKAVKLVNNEIHSLFLSAQQIENLKFSDVVGEITALVVSYGDLKDSGMDQTNSFSINRAYQVDGKSIDSLTQSDVVKITLTPSFSKSAPEGYYEITDVLPAGLRYIENDFNKIRNHSYPISNDKQRIVFGYYYNKDSLNEPITYYARVAAPGIYVADNAVMINYGSNSMSISKQETLNIK